MSKLDERNKGKRVRLVFTSDPYTQLKPGDLGTYQNCLIQPDSRHQHSIQWDSGSTLMLIEDVDKFEFVKRCRFCSNMQAYGTEGSMRCIKGIAKPNDDYAEQCLFYLDENLGRDEAEGNEVLAHLDEDDKKGKRDVMLGKHTKRFRDEQAENDRFVRLVGGVKKADHMQQIWKMSYPQGNCGMLKGKSKEEVFREKAKAEGFTDIQVNRFLDL